MRPGGLPDQDVDVLNGGLYGLVDDPRDLPGERLLLFLGTPFADVALNYGHDSSPLPSSLYSMARSLIPVRSQDVTTHRPRATLLYSAELNVRVVRRIRVPDRYDGQASGLLQAPGLRVPEFGDLRRHTLLLRLWTAWGRDEAQRKGGVVAPPRPHARRRRGHRLGHYHAPEGVGRLRAHGHLQRHARRESHKREALPGRPPHRGGDRPRRRWRAE